MSLSLSFLNIPPPSSSLSPSHVLSVKAISVSSGEVKKISYKIKIQKALPMLPLNSLLGTGGALP